MSKRSLTPLHFIGFGNAYDATAVDALLDEKDARIAELEASKASWRELALKYDSERIRLREELSAARKECEEQSRLNGMGSEREAKLMAALSVMRAGVERISELRYSEAGEPFDDALNIADSLLKHKKD